MLEYTWTRIHLPSGKRWRAAGRFQSPLDFYRYLNLWNRLGGGKWLYITDGEIRLGPRGQCYDIREIPEEADVKTIDLL